MAGFPGDRDNNSGDLTYTAPGGGVVKGNMYKIQESYVVARETVAAGLPFLGALTGAVWVEKVNAGGSAILVGDAVYFITATNNVTGVLTSNTLVGKALTAAGDTATQVLVWLTQSEI